MATKTYEDKIRRHERKIQKLWKKIQERDARARAAYNETTRGLHNLQYLAWEELPEQRRDEWRDKVGINRYV